MLSVCGLSKRFNAITAVDNFVLGLSEGELLVLLGPSGCGKTTLIRLIAGLETPDTGSIFICGEDCTDVPPQRRNVAMVFQQYALYPQRTVRDNIEYPLRLRGTGSEECRKKVEWIASVLGIAALLERRPGQLSGGEAQRVALARALVRQPACFLLDEPLSNLDAQLRVRARAEIKRLQQAMKVTTIYVTHDQEDAVALADRIAIMNNGRLVQVGTVEDIFHHPATAFVASFLGKPPMNLLLARVVGSVHDSVTIALEMSDSSNQILSVRMEKVPANGRRLLVGFRPDHIMLAKGKCREDEEASWFVSGHITLIEGLEPEHVVHCDSPAGILLVRTSSKPTEGSIHLILPASKAHYFDADTGERLV